MHLVEMKCRRKELGAEADADIEGAGAGRGSAGRGGTDEEEGDWRPEIDGGRGEAEGGRLEGAGNDDVDARRGCGSV